jgi:hypothetical protein
MPYVFFNRPFDVQISDFHPNTSIRRRVALKTREASDQRRRFEPPEWKLEWKSEVDGVGAG